MNQDQLEHQMQNTLQTTEAHIIRTIAYLGRYLSSCSRGPGGRQFMLTKLLAQGGRISQRELQERTQISAAALSEVLTRLEDEGLIERTRSIQDRRQLDVMLTQFGKEQALLSAQKMLNFQQWALAPLNEDERLLLANLLEKVAQHWRAQDKIMKEASCKN